MKYAIKDTIPTADLALMTFRLPHLRPNARRILDYMDRHRGKPLSAEDWAAQMHMSKSAWYSARQAVIDGFLGMGVQPIASWRNGKIVGARP